MLPTLPVRASFAPLAVKTLDWTDTTEALFAHFAASPWAMLLDSANANHPDARFDIIVANPIAMLKVYESHCDLTLVQQAEHINERIDADQCPFALMQALTQALYPESKPSILPFVGGALGAFSYDLGRKVEHLPSIATDDIPLPLAAIGFYDWALIKDNQSNQWQLLHYLGDAALNAVFAELNAARQAHTLKMKDFTLTSPFGCQISREAYNEKFAAVQAYLHSGDCYQINLTQRFEAGYQGDEWQAYLALRSANKGPFSAFIRLEEGSILSISPERFLKLADGKVETKPIKGTQPRSSDIRQDAANAEHLRQSAKDRAENLMIVDLLRNDIGRVASPGSVAVPKLFEIESFPAVHHLVSTVTGELAPGLDAYDLLKAAFPGGSITGAPKIRAMEIIEELEPSRRSIYCGSIGYISQDGKMDTSITIRTLAAVDGKLYCWAGGGVVADSVADAEYQETFDKVSRILPQLEQTLGRKN
ncbi:aminodeoxychorismate synthase component I [Shewanella sp.]|uniref:aminodeoxychorismate synthase component I n=1 Tax=Shewanella sp. TaxID=50422 RepID=UPI0035621137